ncbi:MAG: AAA family ATPase, partial [Lachnospiraceae bacterium]|nr:AAA family ATPase [Lachnospiraceae bacterium]
DVSEVLQMGIYFNPGNENFRGMLKARIYVDKTMMIEVINRFIDIENKYICISRPRRFGKTIAGNMLSSYYSKGCDSRELFSALKISKAPGFEDKLNKYNVIKIDLNSEYQNRRNRKMMLRDLERDINEEIQKEYPEIKILEGDSLTMAIQKVYGSTGDTFMILMDEYDVLVREQADRELFDDYLSFLNGLFKSDTLRPAISLAYLTGILPVVRDKIQSKLNNFMEYTILDAGELAEFVGFTASEVEELCKARGVDYEECKRWYDGYEQHGIEIYNPESVVRSVDSGEFDNYWGKTSSYKVISDRIRSNYAGIKDSVIKMLAGESVDVNVTRYLNTMDSFENRNDEFTYLIHVGYLAYNKKEKTCRIPNNEIRQEWLNAIETQAGYEETNRIVEDSKELLKETIAGNSDAVARALDESHIHVTSNRSYNNEDALQSAIYLAYIYALNRYTIIKEMTSGKGFADVVFIPFVPDIPAMVIELKRNDCAESAINQIKEKKYFDSLSHYSGDLLFVGIDYDEKKKTHTCRIERFEKS